MRLMIAESPFVYLLPIKTLGWDGYFVFIASSISGRIRSTAKIVIKESLMLAYRM